MQLDEMGYLIVLAQSIQEALEVVEVVLLEVVSDGGEHTHIEALALLVRGGALHVQQLTRV